MHRRTRVLSLLGGAAAVLAVGLGPVPAAQAAPAAPDATYFPHTTTPEPGHGTSVTCDPLGGAVTRADNCLLPYPDDFWTKADPTSATGRRLDMPVTVMPRNASGAPISPTDYAYSDGFSAGAQILANVPGMTSNDDLVPSGLAPVTNIGAYAATDAGAVLVDTVTGARVPIWSEVDQYAQGSDATGTPYAHLLMVHPAANLVDGRRYVVALRHLHLDDGSLAPTPAAFVPYRDGTATDARAAHMADLLDTLAHAGVAKTDLYLAWDFTTASTANVTGRLTAIRDDTFRQLGDTTLTDGVVQGSAPAFTVTKVTDNTTSTDNRIARVVTGTFTMPCYLAPSCTAQTTGCASSTIVDYCTTPAQFALDPTKPDATPTQTPGQTYTGLFQCNIPYAALSAATPARPSLYGHGLFGSLEEVNAGNVKDMASEHDVMECATDWYGMAAGDVPTAAEALSNLSLFPTLIDKVVQGEAAWTVLARDLAHAQGFCANAAFQRADGSCLYDRSNVYYDGNSQGGIYGGTVCAVSVDVRRCVLGVPGMDYAVLLPRSSDYVAEHGLAQTDPTQVDPTSPTDAVGYSDLFDTAYPDQSQRILILDLIQTLWDRGDPNGFASHMTTDPLPNTPTHTVLMQLGYGDHQVANITAETEARTIGAEILTPPLEAGRSVDTVPYWGITPIASAPYAGSGITIFDSGPLRANDTQGTNPPPAADVPNRSGQDPHEGPRASACGRIQKSDFLQPQGLVTDPCPGPKLDQGYTGGLVAAPTLPDLALPVLGPVLALVAAGALGLRRRVARFRA